MFITSVILLSIVLLGCQSPQLDIDKLEAQKALEPNEPNVEVMPLPRIAFAPGDEIEIKFFYTPQLNEIQTVRPDGKIALQLVGEVDVQDKTPAEVQKKLIELYEPHLEELEVAVIIRSFWNRRVFVGGQVMKPGIVEMPGRITALEAITQAGGFDLREAELKNVVIIRHKDDKRYGYSIDLKSAVSGDTTKPFYLEPQDIVYVPRTKIAKVDQWIDQHINKIIPDTGVFFIRTYGRTSIGVGSYR